MIAHALTLVLAASPASPGAAPSPAKAALHEVLPFIHDDYPRALALARTRKVPLFIEAWAPW